MKLVYLTLEAPREGQASYVHVHEIIAGLKKRGVNVSLYQPYYTHKKSSPNLLLRLLLSIPLQCQLWWNWPKGGVLYMRAHYMAFPSAVIARLFKIPIIHEINGPYGDVFVTYPRLNFFKNILIRSQRWQYKKATRLIAVTKELVEWANKEAERKDTVFISNGANTKIFTPDLPKPKDAPAQYVVFFGGLTRWHGVDVMIDACAKPHWPDNVKLLVIGDGQKSNSVINAAKTNDKIIFKGRLPYKEVAPYVTHAIAGLVMIGDPAKRSATGVFPLKLFETLACATPALVSDLPGQSDFIKEHKCGIVIPMDDANTLATEVANLSNNPNLRKDLGQNGHQAVLTNHSWDSRAQDTLDIIKNLKA